MAEWIVYVIIGCALALYVFIIRHQRDYQQVTTTYRGTGTERNLVHRLLKQGIKPQAIFHDLYLNTYKNNYSQIDLVVPTKVGIIVFEVQDYSGWLFGTGHQQKWVQVLNYGKEKKRFYNPILQNTNHIKQLSKKLPKENMPYFSIIVFYGDCELREINYVPKNTYLTKPHTAMIAYEKILRENPPATYTDKHNIMKVLSQAVQNGENPNIKNQHIENIQDNLGKGRILQ